MKLERARKYREKNRELLRQRAREYYLANREARIKYQREQTKKAKGKPRTELQKKKNREKAARMRRENPAYRIACSLRAAFHKFLAKRQLDKPGSFCSMVGCTNQELVVHIESQWEPGWSWENYGTVWEIDHIFPIAATDLSAIKKTFHYTNLRPLAVEANRKKSSKCCA